MWKPVKICRNGSEVWGRGGSLKGQKAATNSDFLAGWGTWQGSGQPGSEVPEWVQVRHLPEGRRAPVEAHKWLPAAMALLREHIASCNKFHATVFIISTILIQSLCPEKAEDGSGGGNEKREGVWCSEGGRVA